mgnify:CR=1 FL=1
MGIRHMRKLKVGYWPLSQSLNSAGDRRRLKYWADARGHSVVTNLSQKVDILVASENSDFNSPYFEKNKASRIEKSGSFVVYKIYLSVKNETQKLL